MLNPTPDDLDHTQGRASAFRHIAIHMSQQIGQDRALKFVQQAKDGHIIAGTSSSAFRAGVEDAYLSFLSDLNGIFEST